MNRITIRRAAMATAAAVLGSVATYAVLSETAEAIPAIQRACLFQGKSIVSDAGWQPVGLGVRIDNGTSGRQVVTHLATDMGVESAAEVRVGYSIDGGPVQEKVFGPGNLANHTEFFQTRSTMAVIPLSAGVHTVRPFWRVSGVSGKQGFFENGCFTAEGRTR